MLHSQHGLPAMLLTILPPFLGQPKSDLLGLPYGPS